MPIPRPHEPGREPRTRHDADATLAPQTPADYAPTLGPDQIAPDGTPFEPGRVFGDYELLTFLARGGMGLVYKARQISLNRVVALKMISRGQLASLADVARFRTEAEAAATLDHPNILPVYEVGEQDGLNYFSMKLTEGGSLADRFTETWQSTDKRTAVRRVVPSFVDVCRAVHFAHQRGVLHRDLKPANVLIDSDGHAYVTDFGLAKRVEGDSGLTQSGAILGTPSYMAPEQARADKGLSTAADVYSLGAVLYELIVGEPPFRGETQLATVMQVMHEEPRRPRSLDANVDRDLETIALKCLEKEPARRYPSAFALADDLERWLRGEPILARPSTAIERTVKWMKRRPAAAALVGVCLLGSIVLIAGLTTAVWIIAGKHEQTARALRREKLSLQRESEARTELAATLAGEKQIAYFQRIAAAQFALQGNNVAQAERFLDSCAEDLRGWEWRYLKRQCHGELATLPRALGTVDRLPVAISPDGRTFAIVDVSAKVIRLGDTDTGQTAGTIPFDARVRPLPTFDPTGRLLAIAHPEGVQLWSVTDQKRVAALADAPPDLQSLAFSRDGARVAAGGSTRPTTEYPKVGGVDDRRMTAIQRTMQGMVRIWQTTGGPPTHKFDRVGRSIAEVMFDEDGKRLMATSEMPEGWTASHRVPGLEMLGARVLRKQQRHHGGVIAWDLTTTPANELYQVQFLSEQLRQNSQVAFSPDGRRFAAISLGGRRVRLHDAATGAVLSSRGGNFTGLAFHPEGRELAIVQSLALGDSPIPIGNVTSKVEILDVPSGNELRSFLAGTAVEDVAYHPNGKLLALAGEDATVKLLETNNGLPLQTLRGHVGGAMYVGFSADGRRLLSLGEDRSVKLWDVSRLSATRRQSSFQIERQQAGPGPREFTLLRHPVPFHRELTVVGPEGQEKPLPFPSLPGGDGVWSVFSGTGRLLALALPKIGGTFRAVQGPYRIELWGLSERRLLRTIEPQRPVSHVVALALSNSGDKLAVAIGRGAATVAVNPSQRPDAGAVSEIRVIVWDTATGRELYRVSAAHQITAMDFLPGGELVTVGRKARRLAIHDAATGAETRLIEMTHEFTGEMAISPDGTLAAVAVSALSATDSTSVLVCDLRTGTIRAALADAGRVFAFSRDSQRLATGRTTSDAVQLWDCATGELILVLSGQGRSEVRQLEFSIDGQLLTGRYMVDGIRVFDATALPPSHNN